MGRLHLVNLEGRIYSCKHCQTHLALYGDIISKTFHCKHGKAYLFEKVSFRKFHEMYCIDQNTGVFKPSGGFGEVDYARNVSVTIEAREHLELCIKVFTLDCLMLIRCKLSRRFVTDVIGIHALFGEFVVGIVMPKDGPFIGVLIEKIEDIVYGLFILLYFVLSGLKTNVTTIEGAQLWGLLVLVIFTACFGNIVGTLIVSMIFKVLKREAFALGFLMNTKWLVELIVLNIGKNRKVLNDKTFAILVLMALFTTFITTPIVMGVYKPARKSAPYKHRTIQRKDLDTKLRVLAYFHSNRNIPSIINLTESSRGFKRLGVLVYAMHLMELSERSSAISINPWFTRLETTVFSSGTRNVTTAITWLSPLKLIGNSAALLLGR
ncbi:hypothetical protein GIB67_027455 [Kingdonia uniflora]|uniref:Yippee domain-containing protein n=1 Tax=Kingdonia uniflora TaxID=39325 RepID=A0A7J7MFT5_9MAGN|nr:hypothetical protein GIB67_027455 [Kingdonia uniflora]